jgi:hypothetical protein
MNIANRIWVEEEGHAPGTDPTIRTREWARHLSEDPKHERN